MKSLARKDEILKTAAKLFKQKGYNAVTMRDLAKEMGIKAASLYNHIESKQDILQRIVISLAEEFTANMVTVLNSNQPIIEKLKTIIIFHINISHKYVYEMASLNNEWIHLEEQKEYYLELRNAYENDFKRIITNGIELGKIVGSNPEVILFSILSTLRSLYLWIPKKEELNIEELTTNLIRVLIKGIEKK